MRKTELKIKLSNLNHNIDVIKEYTNADIQAVVKANSYGLSASEVAKTCLLYTSPSPRDRTRSRMPSSA